ncbi:hypothetical protein HK104_005612 [Borealophlyctis nickersoniae]|nr:hypothetical protein HK104_005612 [Borealophlyctis nickersoniae]
MDLVPRDLLRLLFHFGAAGITIHQRTPVCFIPSRNKVEEQSGLVSAGGYLLSKGPIGETGQILPSRMSQPFESKHQNRSLQQSSPLPLPRDMELHKVGTRDGSQPVAGRTPSRRVLISEATPASAPSTTEVASDTEEAHVTRTKAKKPAVTSRIQPERKRKRSVEPEVVSEGGSDEGRVSEKEKPAVRPKRQVQQRKEAQKNGKGVKTAATQQTARRVVRDGEERNEEAKGEDEGKGKARTRGGSSAFVQIEVPAAFERPPPRASSQPHQSGQGAAAARSATSRRRSSISAVHAPAKQGVCASPSKEANGPRPPKRMRETTTTTNVFPVEILEAIFSLLRPIQCFRLAVRFETA